MAEQETKVENPEAEKPAEAGQPAPTEAAAASTDAVTPAEPATSAKSETQAEADAPAEAETPAASAPSPESATPAKPAEPDAAAQPDKSADAEPPATEEPAADPEAAKPSDAAEVAEVAKPAEVAEADTLPPSNAAPEAGSTAAGARPARKPPARRTLVVVGMCVVLVALWATGIFLFLKHRSAVSESAVHHAALAAARTVATDLTSISGDTAPATIDKLKQETTGGFRDQISGYAAAAQAMLQQNNAGSRGTVTAAGIENGDSDRVSALVTVTAIVSNNKLPNAQPLSYRLAIQLQHEGDRWLTSDITFIQ